ncbi:hypothetical protein HDU93_003875, partial [Gonapodya sp. JEL0774]
KSSSDHNEFAQSLQRTWNEAVSKHISLETNTWLRVVVDPFVDSVVREALKRADVSENIRENIRRRSRPVSKSEISHSRDQQIVFQLLAFISTVVLNVRIDLTNTESPPLTIKSVALRSHTSDNLLDAQATKLKKDSNANAWLDKAKDFTTLESPSAPRSLESCIAVVRSLVESAFVEDIVGQEKRVHIPKDFIVQQVHMNLGVSGARERSKTELKQLIEHLDRASRLFSEDLDVPKMDYLEFVLESKLEAVARMVEYWRRVFHE